MILRYSPSLVLHAVILFLFLAAPAQADTSHIYLPSTSTPPPTPNITTRQRAAASRPEYIPHPAHDLLCRPFGECEPCPKDELDQPFCFPFGNRRLLHCLPADQVHEGDGSDGGDSRQPAGEVPAWESCGKVIRQERQEYQEFVIANLLFLIVALGILWGRSSALAAAQYRQLAARIGIPGSSWRT